MQTYHLKKYGFSIVLPDKWELTQKNNTVSCFDPINGVGALQISVFFFNSENEISSKEELINFIKKRGISYSDIKQDLNIKQNSTSLQYVQNDEFWYVMVLVDVGKIFFITYNCEIQDQFIEIDEIEKIISGIKQE